MNTYQQRVQELAHQIWESEGKPQNQAHRHWEAACKIIAAEPDFSASQSAPSLQATSQIATQAKPSNPQTPKSKSKPATKKKSRSSNLTTTDETLLAVQPSTTETIVKTKKKTSSKKYLKPIPVNKPH